MSLFKHAILWLSLINVVAVVSGQSCNSTDVCPVLSQCCDGQCIKNVYTIPLGDPCDLRSTCKKCAGRGACIGSKCVLSTQGCPCDDSSALCSAGFCEYIAKNSYMCGPKGDRNGANCFVDDNCASKNCIRGKCQGIGYADEPCERNSDCLTNLCASSPPGSPKKCIAPLPKDALCKITEERTDPCAAGLACSRDLDGTRLICVEKYSKPAGAPCLAPPVASLSLDESCAGSVCSVYSDNSQITSACDAAGVHQAGDICDQRTIDVPVCAAGLICNAPTGWTTRAVCIAPYSVTEGGACVGHVACADGLVCKVDSGQFKCVNTLNQPCNATTGCGNRARCENGVCALDSAAAPLQRVPTCAQEFIDVLQGRCYSDVVSMTQGVEFTWTRPECEAVVLKYLCCKEYCHITAESGLRYPYVVDCAQHKLVSWSPEKCCGETDVNNCQLRVQGCASTPGTSPSTPGSSPLNGTETDQSQLLLMVVFGGVCLLAIVGLIVVIARDKRNKVW